MEKTSPHQEVDRMKLAQKELVVASLLAKGTADAKKPRLKGGADSMRAAGG